MPDVFVADDSPKQDDVPMHKRTPVESGDTTTVTQAAIPQPIPSVAKGETASTSNVDVAKSDLADVPITIDDTQHIDQDPEAIHTPAKVIQSQERDMDEILQEEEHRNAIPLFTSFWQNPQGVYFDTQEANEHILLFLRRHFVTNVPWIFTSFIFLLLPIGFNYFVQITHFSVTAFPPVFAITSLVMYYLVVITVGFLRFLDWYFNISLITARRVMDIELKDLVYKKISATKISLVQDVNFQQTGTIRTVFNYGEVLVQTAGATDNFFINAVPHPEVVVQVLEELIGKGKEGQPNVPA